MTRSELETGEVGEKKKSRFSARARGNEQALQGEESRW